MNPPRAAIREAEGLMAHDVFAEEINAWLALPAVDQARKENICGK